MKQVNSKVTPVALALFMALGVSACVGGSDSSVVSVPETPPVTTPPVEPPPVEPPVEGPTVIDVNTADSALPSFVSFDNTTPAGKMWQKVDNMSDEFDFWDESKWLKTTWNYGGTPVFMRNENSGVSGGMLWIKATLDDTSDDQWFETSRVRSKAKIKFPIYTEARIKTAHISAYNTFWLNNGDSNNRDEIDIIENNSNPSYTGAKYDNYPYEMHSQYFIVKAGVTERDGDDNPSDNRELSAGNTLKGVPWNEEFHVYGAWWKDKNTVQFYLNGEEVNFVTSTQDFTLEQHIIFDLWTQDSSWVGGLPEKEELLNNDINTMEIDWVRTWSLVDKPAE
ncbi:family 16 glycosylhydrolase [Paraglaciecola aquimarina]|uniref:Family 16 glycosylhydrolase n=1 Tax=Paraglaciecola aquimarina TaxID=1235557 RepID=A0ABU3SXF1_9ALTE|nr:family 16 glycosylhydrolase [Paraglaciecola aquimarina]MDU0354689.1 family 16 glycosylhydrolase [Paraglaciecola aquimarina]